MLISLLAGGSRGDTQPYIALGAALQQAGHRARIVTHQAFEPFVRQFGLDYAPLHGDLARVMTSQTAQTAMQADNPLKILRSFGQLRALAANLQEDFYTACQGADAIIYHPGPSIGYFAAQQLGIPAFFGAPFPMTPTRSFPALAFYTFPRLGKGFNLLSHKLFERIMWFAAGPTIQQFWKQKFGYVPKHFGPPYNRGTTLISCSPHVFPRPTDWSAQVHMDGYWFLNEEPGWLPPANLERFLENGAPPVYIGFGSVGDAKQASATTALIVEALGQSGLRGVLATGWGGLSAMGTLPENIFALESAPHAWLFPRMAAVVHHGGAGTTAAGLRAGVPGVIIPHANDQFAWGRRIHELGVGSRPIPRKNLTAKKLTQALEEALSARVRSAAQALGAKIELERGAESAAQVICAAI